MFEIKLCSVCCQYQCKEHNSNTRTMEVNQATMRACSDCEGYVPFWQMITKADGRVICRPCQKAIDDKAREQAQVNLFVQQESLF